MNNRPESESRRKFIVNAAGLGILGAIGAGYLLSSCNTGRTRYEAPVSLDKAPDGPPLKAGLIGCGGRDTGAAINFLNAGPNLQVTALGDVFQHRIDNCRQTLKERYNVEMPDDKCFVGFNS